MLLESITIVTLYIVWAASAALTARAAESAQVKEEPPREADSKPIMLHATSVLSSSSPMPAPPLKDSSLSLVRSADQLATDCARVRISATHRLSAALAGNAEEDLTDEMRAECVHSLRCAAESCQPLADSIVRALESVQKPGASSSRAGYLKTLSEHIGPSPSRTWRDEWEARIVENSCIKKGRSDCEYDPKKDSIEAVKKSFQTLVDEYIGMNWQRDDAEVYVLHMTTAKSMARALRDNDACYAASTYAMCDAFFTAAKKQVQTRQQTGCELPPLLYKNLSGSKGAATEGLISNDPAWAHIERPDRTGFCGITSSSLTMGTSDPKSFSAEGFLSKKFDRDGTTR